MLLFSGFSAIRAKKRDKNRPVKKSATTEEKPRSANQFCESIQVTSTISPNFTTAMW